ncbi:MAG TPA: aldehyde dehydrogenase family protein, partial [Solirubrobacterales bacterium]|nr:aldehyde dehydrogenase family protein [Solirubrobacterales bacterium]
MPGSDHETRLLIGGELVAGTGAPVAVENPYTTETIVEVNSASAEQVEAVVAAAREAWPAWAHTTAGERCELLHEVARRLREEAEALARTMTAEGGKPLVENRDELEWTAAAFDYYAEIGRDHAGRVIPPIESTQLAMVVKDPLGVVGCIVPWNYPLLLLAWKVAPALAAGNCVVCKPSELTPLSTLMLAGAFEHLPAGVVNLVAGAGDVGAAIASHPGVDCIAFTGSVATGKKVAAACVEHMRKFQL